MRSSRLRVAVIFGGKSVEHEVSVVSTRSFAAAMDRGKYEPVFIGVDGDGRWYFLGASMEGIGQRVEPGCGQEMGLLSDLFSETGSLPKGDPQGGRIDVVVPMIHGSFGEDGCIQGLCELAGIPYVGAGVLGSALGMDKITMKRLVVAEGISVPKFIEVTKWEWQRQSRRVKSRVRARIGYPCFVKPSNSGSSVGITKVNEARMLANAIETALQFDRRLIIERAIDARELECGVLGNDEPIASVVGEIVPCNDFYDYEAKYINKGSELIIPAKIRERDAHNIRNCAVRAFKLLDVSGMARVDFLMERSTKRVYFSELNTIPGFTDISMYPKLWEASGVSYPELVDRLIEFALERHREKASRRFDY